MSCEIVILSVFEFMKYCIMLIIVVTRIFYDCFVIFSRMFYDTLFIICVVVLILLCSCVDFVVLFL